MPIAIERTHILGFVLYTLGSVPFDRHHGADGGNLWDTPGMLHLQAMDVRFFLTCSLLFICRSMNSSNKKWRICYLLLYEKKVVTYFGKSDCSTVLQ